ncbi:intradiol ring-cleavage dioxygenase [Amaricoccus sp. W119]|uniref:intradiol ring-cleavage dioxygenase n=1 Tax=Amaricoccus sp. W119 TaxID=3391833 RepID=UPI0039A6E114
MPNESPTTRTPVFARRAILRALALSPVAALVPGLARAAAEKAGLVSANVCMLTPETTEGPFYVDPRLVRADITEGRSGAPLELRMQVVTADCRPIEGARVDVWHCDAEGLYSGYADQLGGLDMRGETFLRGTQMTGRDGIAHFTTIWPGWYPGRTAHVHYKVFLGRSETLTSQLFFPDGASEVVYGRAEPYRARETARYLPNARDGIARRAGEGAFAEIAEHGAGYRATLVVGVAA